MDKLRPPFLVVAVILCILIVFIDAGSRIYIGHAATTLPRPGLGIPSLVLVDLMLLLTVGLFGLSLVVPARVLGAVHGIVTFVVAFLVLLGSIAMIFLALTLLIMMVTLLLAVPFGTIAYFAGYSDFDLGAARATLGTLMLLKLGVAIFLFLSQQRLIEIKALVLLVLTSLLANIVVTFLHGLVPEFLVSILDAVAAIIVGILGAIWALIKLIGSIPAIVKGVRLDRHLS